MVEVAQTWAPQAPKAGRQPFGPRTSLVRSVERPRSWTLSRDEAVAFISWNAPGVCPWSEAPARAFRARLDEIASNAAISAIVLHGYDLFDARGHALGGGEHEAVALAVSAIADCPTPVYAAISGAAVGFGLELALACHGRVAAPESLFQLPQVLEGRLPVNGGVERLTRLIGADEAARMIVFGEVADARDALRTGLVDAIGTEPPPRLAVARARAGSRRRERPPRLSPAEELPSVRLRIQKRAPGQAAPLAALHAMEAALRLPPRRALAEVERLSATLAHGVEGAALRYAAAGRQSLTARAREGRIDLDDLAERLAWPMRREAVHLVDEGASPAQVDRCLVAYGFPEGPFAQSDRIGLDRVFTAAKDDFDGASRWRCYSPTLDLMLDAGRGGGPGRPGWRFGMDSDGEAPRFDPRVDDILRASAMFQRLHRRPAADEDVLARCFNAAVNGAAEALTLFPELGPSGIDAVWTTRLHFPRWLGGPLFQAGTIGWGRIVAALRKAPDGRQTAGPPAERLLALAAGADDHEPLGPV